MHDQIRPTSRLIVRTVSHGFSPAGLSPLGRPTKIRPAQRTVTVNAVELAKKASSVELS